jgi:hypothetical protein
MVDFFIGRLVILMSSMTSSLPICSLCKLPVVLEASKTDENGKPVHEECYVLNLSLLKKQPPASTRK